MLRSYLICSCIYPNSLRWQFHLCLCKKKCPRVQDVFGVVLLLDLSCMETFICLAPLPILWSSHFYFKMVQWTKLSSSSSTLATSLENSFPEFSEFFLAPFQGTCVFYKHLKNGIWHPKALLGADSRSGIRKTF